MTTKRSLCSALLLAAVLCMRTAHAADLIVSAAASLQNAFVEIGKDFEKANAGTKVLFNFGASGQLVQQIGRGAPADVLATADQDSMDRAHQQRLVVPDTRTNFVSNTLVLVVPTGSPGAIRSFADLSKPEIKRVGIGTPESVPAGRYAKEALEQAGIWNGLKDKYVYGQNVRQVLDYVARGEVDAGFVYITDAALMKDRVSVVAEAPTKTRILYPIVAVKGSGSEKLARAFVSYTRSEAAQTVLAKYGFGKP
jgi:molybdate transport system substrate-binding protein